MSRGLPRTLGPSAGNIWSINTWKPRFSTDVLLFDDGQIVGDAGDEANPGGDGIIVFVGLALGRSEVRQRDDVPDPGGLGILSQQSGGLRHGSRVDRSGAAQRFVVRPGQLP